MLMLSFFYNLKHIPKKLIFNVLGILWSPKIAAQSPTNYGFYRYNWQYMNPAVLNYEYFHRIQNVEGNWYSPRQLNVSSGYRSQSVGLLVPRTSMSCHLEWMPSLFSTTQRGRPSDFLLKLGAGILNDSWGDTKQNIVYAGISGGLRLSKQVKLLIGANFGRAKTQLDLSQYLAKDPNDPQIQRLLEPKSNSLVIPGILITDFKRFYAGWSYFYPLEANQYRQHQIIIGYNFVNEREFKVARRNKRDPSIIEPVSIKTLTYDSGLSLWIRTGGFLYSNALGDASPVSALINWRFQLPVKLGWNHVWSNLGYSTAKHGHLEIGYTNFAASEYGIQRFSGMDIDWRIGFGWDMPLTTTAQQLGNSFECNFGIAF
jgi:Type IX secretion system membrane protein PorP/SprF